MFLNMLKIHGLPLNQIGLLMVQHNIAKQPLNGINSEDLTCNFLTNVWTRFLIFEILEPKLAIWSNHKAKTICVFVQDSMKK